jgi:hypothetical protein
MFMASMQLDALKTATKQKKAADKAEKAATVAVEKKKKT